MLLGVIPVGTVYGAKAGVVGIPAVAKFALAVLIIAGAPRLVAIELIGGGCAARPVVPGAAVITADHAFAALRGSLRTAVGTGCAARMTPTIGADDSRSS